MERVIFTGAVTTEKVSQLNINTLVRNCYIREGKRMEGNSYQAREGDPELIITSDLTTNDRFVKITFKSLINARKIEQIIKICAVKSNLKGEGKFNLYFVCGVSGNKAKVMYFDYWNEVYVQRKAYPYRIYYPLEICSKDERIFERGYIVRKKLIKRLLEYKNYSYRGDLTTIHKEIGELITAEKVIQLLKEERQERLIQKFNRKIN